jgi:hypothetical protein
MRDILHVLDNEENLFLNLRRFRARGLLFKVLRVQTIPYSDSIFPTQISHLYFHSFVTDE